MIVLRFSDYERPTIAEHLGLLERLPCEHVWWGWWKKIHEPFSADVFDSLSARIANEGSVWIGLIERADRQYYRAECENVVIDRGRPTSTPEREYTPAYYNERPFPAWFALRSFEQVSEQEWEREFGRVPFGDDTLFVAQKPRPLVESEVMEAEVPDGHEGVLHISDLHFGADHGFVVAPGRVTGGVSLLERILSQVQPLPAAVVVSGDLTTKGDPNGLLSARLFIQELAQRLEIPREAVVVAPGNHDILIDNPEVTRDFRNEQPFRDQMQLFYGREVPNERVHDIRDAKGRHFILGVLNSSRPRRKETMDYGYVGNDRSAPVFRTVQALAVRPRGAAWAAIVMHHHVLSAPIVEEPDRGRPVSLALDAGELISLAHQHGIDAIMHGHQHLPFIGEVRRLAEVSDMGAQVGTWPPVRVLGAGSASAAQAGERIPQEFGANSVSIYRPFGARGFEVECVEYLPRRAAKRVWQFIM